MLGLYVVLSELEDKEAISRRVSSAVEGFETVEYVSNILHAETAVSAHRDSTDGSVILVASGGTEAIVNQIVFQSSKPVLLWANPENNSLAAALEAYAALKNRFPLKIMYAPLDGEAAAGDIQNFRHIASAIARIDRGVVGCLGAPSPWLLTSHGVQSFKNFRTHIVSIKLERLLERYDLVPSASAQAAVEELRARTARIETSEKDLLSSTRLYLALKDIAAEQELTAFTVRCYDLLDSGLAPCLGISLCNDQGIVAGCEGDLEAIFTMVVASSLNTGPCWLADALRIDPASNVLTLSHCTVPPSLIAPSEPFRVVPQPGFGVGAAVHGPFRDEQVTILRIGGAFSTFLIATGRLVASESGQARNVAAQVKLDGSVESWLEHAPGNHQILLYGDVKARALDFCAFKHITPIVV